MYVQIRNLCFSYQHANHQTIHHFSLDIEQGEILSILGDSGCGKTTLLRLLCGLEIPSCGTIKINNQVMTDEHTFIQPEHRGIGMVFQDYALFPHMTVAENIRFGLKGYNRSEKKQRVMDVLELVKMGHMAKRYPHELSGGQQQRIALARAIAPKPSLLLLDEPFSNLDANLQMSIREELKQIIKKTGITSIIVTHDIEDSHAIADRIITMRNGKMYKSERIHIKRKQKRGLEPELMT